MGTSKLPPEIVNVSPFGTKFLTLWDDICRNAIRIFSGSLDTLLACFMPTTRELKRPLQCYASIALVLPFWTLCTILTLPIGVIFMILWLPISSFRIPYRYSYVKNTPIPHRKGEYTCATTNVCLLYECLTRFNNQQDTFYKAVKIGQNIAQQQENKEKGIPFDSSNGLGAKYVEKLRDEKLACIGVTHREENIDGYWERVHQQSQAINKRNKSTNGHNNNHVHYNDHSGRTDTAKFDHAILPAFPATDFLLIQETWDIKSAKALAKELHRVYPYIVYDARVDSYSSNLFMLSSGTMIASKYPIIDVRFDFYRCGIKQCRMASKGLLQVKVSE